VCRLGSSPNVFRYVEVAAVGVSDAYRGFSRRASDSNSFLSLVGDQAVVSAICGAIIFISELWGAATPDKGVNPQNEMWEHEVVMTLNDIQGVIASRIHSTYRLPQLEKSLDLRTKVSRLCHIILKLLTALTLFATRFTNSSIGKLKSVSGGSKEMTELRAEMQQSYEEIREDAWLTTESQATANLEQLTDAHTPPATLDTNIPLSADQVRRLEAMKHQMLNVKHTTHLKMQRVQQAIMLQRNAMDEMLQQALQKMLPVFTQDDLARQLWDTKTSTAHLSRPVIPAETLNFFQSVAGSKYQNPQRLLRVARMNNAEQNKLGMLLNHSKLRRHLDPGTGSGALLINENVRAGHQTHLHTPATSYAVASLADVLSDPAASDGLVVLVVFCSLHSQTRTAKTVLVHLIAQLVSQCAEVLTYGHDIRNWHRQIAIADFADLQGQFWRLLRSLPSQYSVLCMVDSLDALMTSASRKKDVNELMRYLVGLTLERTSTKVLITEVWSGSGFAEYFGKENIIDLGDAGKVLRSAAGCVDRMRVRRAIMKLAT
jgi:hypothetical protein